MIRKIIGAPESIPTELLRDLLDSLDSKSYGTVAILPLRVILSTFLDAEMLNFEREPIEIFRYSVSNFSLSRIKISGTKVTDGVLGVLAASQTAATLRELCFTGSTLLTDASASLWDNFAQLHTLVISGNYITVSTYDQIFKSIPSLTLLTAGDVEQREASSLLSAAFSYLTNLQSLDVPYLLDRKFPSQRPLREEQLSILRSNTSLCRSLRSIKVKLCLREFNALAQCCPNLTELDDVSVSVRDLRELSQSLMHLEAIRLTHGPSQVEVDWISSSFTRLRSLSMGTSARDVALASLSLERLSSLLRLEIHGNVSGFRFPSSVERAIFDVGRDTSIDAFASLLAAISEHLPNLSDLIVSKASSSAVLVVSNSQLAAILSGCPKLRTARFGFDIAGASFVEISHPKLSQISFSNLDVKPGVMPKLEKVPHARFVPAVLEQPSTHVAYIAGSFSKNFDMSSLCRLAALRTLRLTKVTPEQFAALPGLPRLETMTLSESNMPEATLSAVLPQLRSLRKFLFFADSPSGIADLEWLRSPTLSEVVIAPAFKSRGRERRLRLVPENLPCLTSCELIFDFANKMALEVRGLRALEYLSLRHSEANVETVVDVCDCPELSNILLHEISLAEMRLRELPSLSSLVLNLCERSQHTPLELDNSYPILVELMVNWARCSYDRSHATKIYNAILARSPRAIGRLFQTSD